MSPGLHLSRSSSPPSPHARFVGSVLLCSCCGRVEVRLEGVRFMLDPDEIPLILDRLDELEDQGGPALARRFTLVIGKPRTHLEVAWKGVEALRLLLLAVLDDIDRQRSGHPQGSAPRSPSMN